jgi:hypothetical protein
MEKASYISDVYTLAFYMIFNYLYFWLDGTTTDILVVLVCEHDVAVY